MGSFTYQKTISCSDLEDPRRFAAYDCLTSDGSPSHHTQHRPTVYSGIRITPLISFQRKAMLNFNFNFKMGF